MAVISEVYEIVDRATAPLRSVESAMTGVTEQAGQMGTAGTIALDDITRGVNAIANNTSILSAMAQSLKAMEEQMGKLGDTTKKTKEKTDEQTESTRKSGEEMEKTAKKAGLLSTAIGKLVLAFGGIALVKKAVDLSDELIQTQARLNNINDGLQTTAELQNMIYQAAQRSRADYVGMEQTVASLKAQTGDTFSSVQEAVAFTELLNKQFKLAGANSTAIASTMYNLTQALSTGVLRGQDLNIVMSNAPQIAQRIADYMGMSVGELKKVAAEGKITADIVKNAMLGAADDINAQFENMPMTFGDAMQKLKNIGVKTFQPIGQMMAKAMQSPEFDAAMNNISRAIMFVATIAGKAFSGLGDIIGFLGDNMVTLAPIIMGVAGALGVYATATGIAAAAQAVLNAVQAANPAMLMAIGIGLLIGALMALVNWLHVTAATGHTVFGDIAGVAVGCFAVIQNALAIVANAFLMGAEMIANGWNRMVYTIQTAVVGFAQGAIRAFASVVRGAESAANAIANAFISGANAAIGGINGLINAINQIPGVNIGTVSTVSAASVDHGLSSAIDGIADALDSFKPDMVETVSLGRFETTSVEDAFNSGFNKGAAWGDSVQNGIMDAVGLGKTAEEALDGGSFADLLAGQGDIADAVNGGKDSGGKGKVGSVDKVKKVDNVKLSDEDLKVYRDLAERRYMNNIELKTLAPEINVTLPAGASGNISAQDVADKLKRMLIAEMAAQTSVAHA